MTVNPGFGGQSFIEAAKVKILRDLRQSLNLNFNIEVDGGINNETIKICGADMFVTGFTEIHIYGATGGRLDHFMGVLQILQKPKYIEQNIIIIVEDLQNEIKLLKQGIHEIHKLQSYPYVSFIPVNEVVALSLNGFKYNLNNQPLEKGSTLTLSNEVKESCTNRST